MFEAEGASLNGESQSFGMSWRWGTISEKSDAINIRQRLLQLLTGKVAVHYQEPCSYSGTSTQRVDTVMFAACAVFVLLA